jgi:N-acetylmuramate 1-kinase
MEECDAMVAVSQLRPDRSDAMDAFLARVGWDGASRSMLAGDASFRRYERVVFNGTVAVLMDAPPPWEDVRPFIAVTELLEGCGVTVPRIIARDEAEGFLLLEDLGDQLFTRLLRQNPKREHVLYIAATEALIAIHSASQAQSSVLSQKIKPYDTSVYLREAALFADWFLPQMHGLKKATMLREEYLAIWRDILANANLKQSCLVHRDYHADNLFWLEGRASSDAVGMIDYQDALWGDPAYDLASLLEEFATAIGEPSHDFAARFAVISAQRNAKIIGIFSRLCIRDHKPHYLDYLPRVWAHFTQDLKHPMLAPMRTFIDAQVPDAWRGTFVPDMAVGSLAS